MNPCYLDYVTEKNNYTTYDDFNKNFRINTPDSFNFAYDVVDRIAKEEPNRRAILWTDEEDTVIDYSFKQLQEDCNRACNLFKQYGIKKGDKVMLVLRRTLEFWPIIIALHKLGAIAVPATHLLTEKDVVYRVNAASIKMIIITSNAKNALPASLYAKEKCETLNTLFILHGEKEGFLSYEKEVATQSTEFSKPTGEDYAHNTDPMLLYFTSGTTGMPKMVLHNHYYPLGHIITARYWQQCQDGGLHLTISETGWAKSVWGKLYGQWLTGSAVFVHEFERFNPKKMLENIAKHKITTFCAPPTMYRFLLQEDFDAVDLSNLRYCAVAGEPLNPDMADAWKNKTGISLLEAFGQTEMVVTLATFPFMKICYGSMGKPTPIFDVDLLDENGNSCEAGVTGEICVRANKNNPPMGMFNGYYLDEDKTNSVWNNDIYHTGDVAWRDEWGYYWYVGRADDVIKSSGYRIGPFEVESALLEHPAVFETAITAVPDDLRGQIVKATIVLMESYTPSDELIKELQNHVKKVTAPYKYPRIIQFVNELPKTISGKVRRVELREQDQKN